MTHPACAQCAFRRPKLSVSELLATLDPPIVEAFPATVAELEAWLDEQRGQELGTLQKIADEGLDADWPRRPRAHDYCGYVAGRARVMELRNPSGGCPGYAPGPRPSRACDTCRWLERPPQPTLDIARAAGGTQASLQFARSAATVAEGLARSELMEAVKLGGVLAERPRFLPVCLRLSRPGRAVAGPVLNWTRACGDWTAAGAPPSA